MAALSHVECLWYAESASVSWRAFRTCLDHVREGLHMNGRLAAVSPTGNRWVGAGRLSTSEADLIMRS